MASTTKKKQPTPRELAEVICDRLFLSGSPGGEIAHRLELKIGTEVGKERSGGGWARGPVVDMIVGVLNPNPSVANRRRLAIKRKA